MRREFADPDRLGEFLYHMPNDLLAHTFSPDLAGCAYATKELAGLNARGTHPCTQFRVDPPRHWNSPNVAALSDQINDCPMCLPLLKVVESQFGNLVSPQAACKQQREQRPITLAFQLLRVWRLPERLCLLGCQPIAGSHAQFLQALHASDSGGKIGAQETAICRFICKAPDRAKTEIDRPWREVAWR